MDLTVNTSTWVLNFLYNWDDITAQKTATYFIWLSTCKTETKNMLLPQFRSENMLDVPQSNATTNILILLLYSAFVNVQPVIYITKMDFPVMYDW